MNTERYVTLRLLCAKCPPLLASIVISVTFVACDVSSPARPDLPSRSDEGVSLAVSAPSCPTFEEACLEGQEFVSSRCPLEGKLKKGQHKKCVRDALQSYLHDLEPCFSASELEALRQCILGHNPMAGGASGGTNKERFHLR